MVECISSNIINAVWIKRLQLRLECLNELSTWVVIIVNLSQFQLFIDDHLKTFCEVHVVAEVKGFLVFNDFEHIDVLMVLRVAKHMKDESWTYMVS